MYLVEFKDITVIVRHRAAKVMHFKIMREKLQGQSTQPHQLLKLIML